MAQPQQLNRGLVTDAYRAPKCEQKTEKKQASAIMYIEGPEQSSELISRNVCLFIVFCVVFLVFEKSGNIEKQIIWMFL